MLGAGNTEMYRKLPAIDKLMFCKLHRGKHLHPGVLNTTVTTVKTKLQEEPLKKGSGEAWGRGDLNKQRSRIWAIAGGRKHKASLGTVRSGACIQRAAGQSDNEPGQTMWIQSVGKTKQACVKKQQSTGPDRCSRRVNSSNINERVGSGRVRGMETSLGAAAITESLLRSWPREVEMDREGQIKNKAYLSCCI